MKSIWNDYPAAYRQKEVQQIARAVEGGNCVSVVGLSGSGKSNLLGFFASRAETNVERILLDGNRAEADDPSGLYRMALKSMGENEFGAHPLDELSQVISRRMEDGSAGICLVMDRFDAFKGIPADILTGQLRSLRDTFKYFLTLVIGSRRPLPAESELAELFFANTLYLGPTAPADSRWSIQAFALRNRQEWDAATIDFLIEQTRGYPSFLRAGCEALAAGCPVDADALFNHEIVQHRLSEFRLSLPTAELLERCGLASHPWLCIPAKDVRPSHLTANENSLWNHLQEHAEAICTKDELIQAVWPEDRIYGKGLRDDSLAQLIRRLREKIEKDPSEPRLIQTVPGRGYIFHKPG
jgi:energy-coupling factor transporter ATP-binding protein EcfA2